MDWLLALLIFYIFLFLADIFMTNGKIISPGAIFSVSFIAMLTLAYMYEDILEFYISQETFGICAFAGFIAIFVDVGTKLLFDSKVSKFYNAPVESEIKPISISKGLIRLVLICNILCLALVILSLLGSTGGDFATRMSVYKINLILNPKAVKYHSIISQIHKLLTAVEYVLCYVLIYNRIKFKQKFLTNWSFVASLGIYILVTFISRGARQQVVEIILYCIILYISFYLRSVEKKEIARIIRRVLPIVGVLGALYYYTMHLAGRNQTTRPLLEYVAHNFSGGIYYLNSIIRNNPGSSYFGQNSFTGIYQVLIKIGLVPEEAYIHVHENGRYGNTMTIFGRWYEDFGALGVYIMTFIVLFIFACCFYKYVVRFKPNKPHHFARIMYAKFALVLVWAGYDDGIRPIITMGNLLLVFMFYAAYYVLIKKRIRLKIKI